MGLNEFDRRDFEATHALFQDVQERSEDMTPSQKALVWTLRLWLAVIEPVATIASVGVGFFVLFKLAPWPVAFVGYLVVACAGTAGARFATAAVRRRLFGRVLKSLELAPSAIGGSTSAMLPALRRRDDGPGQRRR